MYQMTLWVAKDGSKFQTEKECSEYEWRLRFTEVTNSLFWFNEVGRRIPVRYNPNFEEEVHYMIVRTREAAQLLEDFCDEIDCYDAFEDMLIDGKGLFYLDRNNIWTNLLIEQRYLNRMAKLFETFQEGIGLK
jgi:hypothetical protein